MKAVVGLSGGIDSTWTAHLLQRDGAEVLAVYLRNAASPADALPRAQEVCRHLGIPLIVEDVTERFRAQVVEPFVAAYACGATPNPCILCNPALKFAVLYGLLLREHADIMATGHYARILSQDGNPRLARGIDGTKDQSYMLYRLSETQRSRLRLPLGAWRKNDVAAETNARFGSLFADTPESQDLCFLDKGALMPFLQKRIPANEGPVFDTKGHLLGRHGGLFRYTIGQRQGLGLAGGPWFVLRKDQASNALTVGSAEESLVREIRCRDVVWHVPVSALPESAGIETRYRTTPRPAHLRIEEGDRLVALPDVPLGGIAPGQSLVAYDGDLVLGGGIIESTC